MRSAIITLAFLMMLTTQAMAATVIFNCDVGGAQFEYRIGNNPWQKASLPKVLSDIRRYEYILTRVTAPGYEDFAQGFEVTRRDINNFIISLEPEISDPAAVPLFGIAGQIKSKRGLRILPGTYKVLCRNMTTYNKYHAKQVSQDIQYNDSEGTFSGVFANLANNRAAAVGDNIFVGVFNSSLTRCYGFKKFRLTEDDVANCGVLIEILIR